MPYLNELLFVIQYSALHLCICILLYMACTVSNNYNRSCPKLLMIGWSKVSKEGLWGLHMVFWGPFIIQFYSFHIMTSIYCWKKTEKNYAYIPLVNYNASKLLSWLRIQITNWMLKLVCYKVGVFLPYKVKSMKNISQLEIWPLIGWSCTWSSHPLGCILIIET